MNAALAVFRRGWGLRPGGLDYQAMRLLAVVAAELEVLP